MSKEVAGNNKSKAPASLCLSASAAVDGDILRSTKMPSDEVRAEEWWKEEWRMGGRRKGGRVEGGMEEGWKDGWEKEEWKKEWRKGEGDRVEGGREEWRIGRRRKRMRNGLSPVAGADKRNGAWNNNDNRIGCRTFDSVSASFT